MFRDDRGLFCELYNQREFGNLIGRDVDFVQDNLSSSSRWVLRGLHYQLPPAAQGKLVTVVSGVVFDVAVDLRRSSPRFGKWIGHELSSHDFRQLWIPEGFAHGFLVLSETAEVLYKTTAFHDPTLERSIHWADPEIGIRWPLEEHLPSLSSKDTGAPGLSDAEVFD